jgi:hypothetical protein
MSNSSEFCGDHVNLFRGFLARTSHPNKLLIRRQVTHSGGDYWRFEGRNEGAKRVVAKFIPDSNLEPIAVGSWERVWVVETSSRRTLRGPSRSSQVNSRLSLSAVPGRARRCSCTTAAPQPPSDRRRRRGRGASGSARSAPRCGPARGSGPQRARRHPARRSR